MTQKIKHIALVQTGVYLKAAIHGEVYYLQVNDFDKTGGAFVAHAPVLTLDERTGKHLLSEGDLLFAAKGTSNFCVLFHDTMGNSVASSSFLVLKIMDKSIISPEYLCWVLNREDVLAFFRNNAVGSSMPSIGKSIIEEYEIEVPPMQIQQKIIAIAGLQRKEQELCRQILDLRDKIIQRQLIKTAQKTQ